MVDFKFDDLQLRIQNFNTIKREIFTRKKFHQSEWQCIRAKNSPDLISLYEQA